VSMPPAGGHGRIGIPPAAGAAAIVIGLAALAGWQLDIAWLTSPVPGPATMNPTTALAIVLLGTAVWLSAARSAAPAVRWVSHACATLAALTGLVRLSGYAFGFDPGIDDLMFAQRVAAVGHGSLLAAHTALTLLLLGVALLVQHRPTQRAHTAVQVLALGASLISLVSVTGHVYGTEMLSGAMALNTALACLLVAVGVLWSHPEGGLAALVASPTAGGVLVRRLVPAIILIPLALGWLRLAGQRAGLYDTAGGTALFVGCIIVVLAAFAAWSARSLARAGAEQRAAERALRVGEERFRLLVDSVRDYAILMLDPTGLVASWNRGAQQIKGYTPEEIVGQHFSRFYPPEAVAAGMHSAALRTAVETGRFEEENWRLRKDGSRFWADVVITPIRDGRGTLLGFAKVTRDLTERQRAEEALRASEERFRTLAATANDAILSADSRGDITYFNPGAERIFGYAVDAVTGKPLTLLMPERFRDAHRAGMARYLATGEARVVGKTVELVGRKRDGTEFPLELSLASWKRGSETAFTAIIRDITERKAAEETLRRYAAQLESANAELDAFAYSVSHDLRAPLRSLDGFSQALLEDYRDRLDAQGTDYLQRVRSASQRMAQLIDDLLNLSHVTRTQMEVGPVDLSTMAHGVTAELRKRDPSRQVEFAIAPALVVQADRGLMGVVIENLLGNAWKFTGKRDAAHIELGVTRHNGSPAYFVRDDGAGFDMTYADKLFGAFQRLHGTADFAGTGIGLATVQRIIHRHGGRVWAEAAPERGATFYFTLP
jgi:PAS domain S-box-containing protein